jgi:hypothetical protein
MRARHEYLAGEYYKFTNLKINPTEALPEQRVNISFSLTRLIDKPGERD